MTGEKKNFKKEDSDLLRTWENIPNPEQHTVEFIEDTVKLIRRKVVELIK